jgi:hypothetical protein
MVGGLNGSSAHCPLFSEWKNAIIIRLKFEIGNSKLAVEPIISNFEYQVSNIKT